MIKITFNQRDGSRQVVETAVTVTLMEAARQASVPGILADCGGACACATCHVVVDPQWVGRLPAVSEVEQSMLEFALGRGANSRLSCQIKLADALDGMVVSLPADQ